MRHDDYDKMFISTIFFSGRGFVLRTLLVGLKGFTGFLSIPNLTFCSDFGSSAQSKGFLRSDLVEEMRHLAFYNAGMPNIRNVTSVIGRASALPGLYKTTPLFSGFSFTTFQEYQHRHI